MYASPQKAKKLYFDAIPKNVDEYIAYLLQYHKEEDLEKKGANPVFHIHNGNPPKLNINFNYSLLLNLVSTCNTDNVDVIWGYLINFSDVSVRDSEFIAKMVEGAMNYYHDFVKPNKIYRKPEPQEKDALLALKEILSKMEESDYKNAELIQNQVYTIGKEFGFDLKNWFSSLYQILLGASEGPRIGTFIGLYGVKETISLITEKTN